MNPKLQALMTGWKQLAAGLSDCTENEVLEMLEFEKRGKRRRDHLVRLHQRYTALRASRERREF